MGFSKLKKKRKAVLAVKKQRNYRIKIVSISIKNSNKGSKNLIASMSRLNNIPGLEGP